MSDILKGAQCRTNDAHICPKRGPSHLNTASRRCRVRFLALCREVSELLLFNEQVICLSRKIKRIS